MSFRENPELEAVARFRDENPAEFERVSPKTRLMLGYYENAKKAAEQERAGTSEAAA